MTIEFLCSPVNSAPVAWLSPCLYLERPATHTATIPFEWRLTAMSPTTSHPVPFNSCIGEDSLRGATGMMSGVMPSRLFCLLRYPSVCSYFSHRHLRCSAPQGSSKTKIKIHRCFLRSLSKLPRWCCIWTWELGEEHLQCWHHISLQHHFTGSGDTTINLMHEIPLIQCEEVFSSWYLMLYYSLCMGASLIWTHTHYSLTLFG